MPWTAEEARGEDRVTGYATRHIVLRISADAQLVIIFSHFAATIGSAAFGRFAVDLGRSAASRVPSSRGIERLPVDHEFSTPPPG